jgi:hypothetical protein
MEYERSTSPQGQTHLFDDEQTQVALLQVRPSPDVKHVVVPPPPQPVLFRASQSDPKQPQVPSAHTPHAPLLHTWPDGQVPVGLVQACVCVVEEPPHAPLEHVY